MTVTVNPGKAQLETTTPQKLEAIIDDLRVQSDNAQTREIFLALFGGAHNLELFCAPGGLGIGAFATLASLPVSTVRHYVELGLVRPYIVNGKFRFVAPNYVEIQHVRQWVDLGMTLEEIAENALERGIGGVMPAFDLNGERISNAAFHISRDEKAARGDNEKLRSAAWDEVARTREDVEAQIQRLEAKQKELDAKLKPA